MQGEHHGKRSAKEKQRSKETQKETDAFYLIRACAEQMRNSQML
jgi:hypothetical protein